jgi:uncharacterized protein (TIGR02147 family)
LSRAPDIYTFLDYREYLKQWLAWRRKETPGYTYDSFAKEAGCSRSALANVISGSRDPKPTTLDAFARAMKLSPSERNFLGGVVELARARTTGRRQDIFEQFIEKPRHKQTRFLEDEPEPAIARLCSAWYLPAIVELARHRDFDPDPKWIAQALVPPIEPDLAARALETLIEIGQLRRTAAGAVHVRQRRLRSRADVASAALARYHRDVVPQLLGRLDQVPAEQRHVIAATALLPEDAVAEAKKILQGAIERIAALADGSDTGSRVYHVGVQLLPVSNPVTAPARRS